MQPPSSSPSPDLVDFERDVLDASRTRPVLVDFWAAWCGPCRVLGPVLERLDAETDAWDLVKIDTEANPHLAQRMGIRGIPAVKLFVDGEVTAEFTGALPEAQIRRWLDEHLPSPQREAIEKAKALLADGRRADARDLLEAAADESSAGEDADLSLLLARAVAFDDPARAAELVNGQHTPEAEAVRDLARFLALDADDLPDAPVRSTYLDAADALRADDVDAALDGLIAVIQRDRAFDEDGARKAAVAIFLLLGEADPVVQKHRPVFNRSLY